MFGFFKKNKNQKKRDAEHEGIFDNLKKETLRGILIIASFIQLLIKESKK